MSTKISQFLRPGLCGRSSETGMVIRLTSPALLNRHQTSIGRHTHRPEIVPENRVGVAIAEPDVNAAAPPQIGGAGLFTLTIVSIQRQTGAKPACFQRSCQGSPQ